MTISTDSVLRAGVATHGDELRLTLDPRFQGLPGAAHGGSVLAAFQAVAGIAGGQEIRGVYRKRVPLGTPLRLIVAPRNGGIACRLFDDTDAMLVEGGVHPVADASAATGATGAVAPGATGAVARGATGDPLPVSLTCFACGLDNRLGLRAQLLFDEASVWGRWAPRETAAAADGTLAPIALTALLDEAAFWLGALASGESGMTTELAVTLHRSIPFGVPIVVAGARSRTRARDDERFWETEVTASDVSGCIVASGRITFVAVRGAARRLVTGMLALNSPDILRRIFPAYAR
jgi:acyl-coenzyme A thioesterase PaaI-like protein